MTASSFSSVSLHPPLILVCAARESETHAAIARSGVFAVNVLASGQESLSRRYSTEGNEPVRFDGLDWRPGPTGAPWIPGAMVHLDCRVHSVHEAGDHTIYVGEVQALESREGEPLIYYRGRYRRLDPR